MELFKSAKTIRLKSYHDKYLLAADDEHHVTQDRTSTSPNAKWTVEISPSNPSCLLFKSCYNRYLTASNEPFLLGMTGRKVLQTVPRQIDSSVEWEPLRDGFQVRLKTSHGQFLRANGGLPPWRNSITHDVPHRSSTQDWVLWDVQVIEVREDGGRLPMVAAVPAEGTESGPESPTLSRDESSSSFGSSSHKSEAGSHKSDAGRTIYYVIAEDDGSADDSEDKSFIFKGTSVAELTEKLEEETELSDIIVCTRSPLNGELYPLLLHLPPNNTMHVVVVQASSKVAKSFSEPL